MIDKCIKKISIIFLIVFYTLATFACSGKSFDKKGAFDTTIKIGVFEPETGKDSDGGMYEQSGIRCAHKIYDKIIVGDKAYNIELVEVDDKSDANIAEDAIKELVDNKVSMIIGSYGSDTAIAASSAIKDAKIPAIACSATNPQVTNGNDYYFRVCYMDPFEATVIASYAKKLGAERVAILSENNSTFSYDITRYLKRACEKYSIDVVGSEKIDLDEQNISKVISDIMSYDPQVIFAPTSASLAPAILKEMKSQKVSAKIIGTSTWDQNIIFDEGIDTAEGAIFTTFYNKGTYSEEEEKFINGISGTVASELHATSALGYDAYLVAYKVIESVLNHYNEIDYSGPLKSEDILSTIHTIKVNGVTGDISFDSDGDLKRKTCYIKEIIGGKIKLLETISID